MVAKVTRLIVPRFRGEPDPSLPYEWNISGPASVNEGEDIDWVVTVDLNGSTPEPGEIVTLDFRGQATPLPSGTFSETIGDALIEAAAATPGASIVQGALTLAFDMNVWAGSITISRGTVNRPEAQGNLECALEIFNPTKGNIGTGVAQVTIVDLATPPGNLQDFTISGAVTRDGLDTISCPVDIEGNLQGTSLGTVTATIGTLSSVQFVDDAGGRFQLVGNDLQIGAVAPNYEANAIRAAGRGVAFYFITLRGTGPDAGTIDKQFRVKPAFAPIVATGGGLATPNITNTLDGFRAALRSTVNQTEPRVTQVTDPVIMEMNGNSSTQIDRSNFTVRGNYRSITIKDRSFEVARGTNIRIEDVVSAPGHHQPGAQLENRDSMIVWGPDGTRGDDLLVFEHCDFTLSTDELCSLISGSGPFNRRVLFRYCAFYHPMQGTGRSDGEDFHPMGLLIYNSQMDVVIDRCFFSGCAQRSPMMQRANGTLIQNCVIAYRGNSGGYGGLGFSCTGSGVQNDQNITAIARGNLFWPHPGQARSHAVRVYRIGTGSYNHLVEAGDQDSAAYPNHFFDPTTLNFADDPVTRAAHCTTNGGGTKASLIDWDPFVPADYGAYETDTPLKRETFFRNEFLLMGACERDVNGDPIPGAHNQHLADVKNDLLTSGGYDGAATPTSIDNRYGTDWNVGGTRGKINGAAPVIVLP